MTHPQVPSKAFIKQLVSSTFEVMKMGPSAPKRSINFFILLKKRCIPNSFSWTLFNKHKNQIMNDELKAEFSNLFISIHSLTNRKEEVNQYTKNISIYPVEIAQPNFKKWIEGSRESEPQNLQIIGERSVA